MAFGPRLLPRPNRVRACHPERPVPRGLAPGGRNNAIRGTFRACCPSAASGAARRLPAIAPRNARRCTT